MVHSTYVTGPFVPWWGECIATGDTWPGASEWRDFRSTKDQITTALETLISEARDLTRISSSDSFPPANHFIDRENGNYILELTVAGYDPEKIDITVTNSQVRVESPGRELDENLEEITRRIRGSKFSVRYKLPADRFDAERVSAEFEHGLLRISLPPKEDFAPRKVKLTVK